MTPPDAPSGEPRKMNRKHVRTTGLRVLREADAALDEYRICSDADGARIRELAAECAREIVNREAVQRVLADVVAKRDALTERCKRLVAKLKVVQWYQPMYNGRASCPDCENFREDGHAPGCGLAALLEDKP